MVAWQTGGEQQPDSSTLPPELRPQSNLPPELRSQSSVPPELRTQSNVPPELRKQSNVPPELRVPSSNVPSELRPQTNMPPESRAQVDVPQQANVPPEEMWQNNSFQSKGAGGKSNLPYSSQSSGDSSSAGGGYCTSYPPPDIDESSRHRSGPVTVDYSHGRSSGDATAHTVTSESILASLHTDLTTSADINNGARLDKSSVSSSNVPLKDKVKGFSQQIRTEISSRRPPSDMQGPTTGNGFLPRQLKNRPTMPRNAMPQDQSPSLMRPNLNQQRHRIGPGSGLQHKGPQMPTRPNMSRKW